MLADTDEHVLHRGMNYTLTPRKIPLMDIAAAVEDVARKFNYDAEVGEPRGSICSIRKIAKPLPPNLGKDESTALKNLMCARTIQKWSRLHNVRAGGTLNIC